LTRLALLIPLALALILGTIARAQPTDPEPETPTPVKGGWTMETVDFEESEYTVPLDPSSPGQATVLKTWEDIDGQWLILVFWERTATGFRTTGPPRAYERAGVLTNARAGDRLALVLVGR